MPTASGAKYGIQPELPKPPVFTLNRCQAVECRRVCWTPLIAYLFWSGAGRIWHIAGKAIGKVDVPADFGRCDGNIDTVGNCLNYACQNVAGRYVAAMVKDHKTYPIGRVIRAANPAVANGRVRLVISAGDILMFTV